MPRTLWAVLWTAVWVDHLNFASYRPEMYVLQLRRNYLLYFFLIINCSQLVACIFQVRGIVVF